MKEVIAIIRPQAWKATMDAVAEAGLDHVFQHRVMVRGKQQGIQVGSQFYEEHGKTMIMVVVDDDQLEKATEVIREAASSGYPGDGRTFVSDIEAAYTLRTGGAGL
jgi:nitrogen regulatory protein PII 1